MARPPDPSPVDPAPPAGPARRGGLSRTTQGLLLPALAVLTAFVVGAFVIVLTDFELLAALGFRPDCRHRCLLGVHHGDLRGAPERVDR